MTTGKRGPLWVDGPHGCPIGGPFDLWRKNYFVEKGVPPADSVKMWPGLVFETVSAIAAATVNENATLAEILARFSGTGPNDELEMAHDYFSQWRRRAPFMPESMQDLPLLPARTEPATVDETLADLERYSNGRRVVRTSEPNPGANDRADETTRGEVAGPVGSFDEARALAATHLPDGWSTHPYGYAVAGGYLVFGARPDPDWIPLLGEDNTFLIGRDGSVVRSVYVGLLPELRDDRRVGDWSEVDEDDDEDDDEDEDG